MLAVCCWNSYQEAFLVRQIDAPLHVHQRARVAAPLDRIADLERSGPSGLSSS